MVEHRSGQRGREPQRAARARRNGNRPVAAQPRAQPANGPASRTAGELRSEANRVDQQLDPLAAAVCKSGDAQRDPKCARCSENLHLCELGLGQIASALALSKSQQRQGGARAGVQVADISNFSTPHFRAKHFSTSLEVNERLGGTALGKPEPCTGGRDQDCADPRRPALLRQKRDQRLVRRRPIALLTALQDGRRMFFRLCVLAGPTDPAKKGVGIGKPARLIGTLGPMASGSPMFNVRLRYAYSFYQILSGGMCHAGHT